MKAGPAAAARHARGRAYPLLRRERDGAREMRQSVATFTGAAGEGARKKRSGGRRRREM